MAELDIISHKRDTARLGQSKDKSSADETTKNKAKQKPPHTTLSSAPQPILNVDGLGVVLRPVKGKCGSKHSDAKQMLQENVLEF